MVGGGDLEEGETDALGPQLVQQGVHNVDIRYTENDNPFSVDQKSVNTVTFLPKVVLFCLSKSSEGIQ